MIRADRVAIDANAERLKAEGNVRYTGCVTPTPLWFISADELTLDQNENSGMIKDAWLHLGAIPFLYMPRYRIDLSEDKRKSGLLSPRLSYNSKSGIKVGTPLYLNIAPNKDATITPTLRSRRGCRG